MDEFKADKHIMGFSPISKLIYIPALKQLYIWDNVL